MRKSNGSHYYYYYYIKIRLLVVLFVARFYFGPDSPAAFGLPKTEIVSIGTVRPPIYIIYNIYVLGKKKRGTTKLCEPDTRVYQIDKMKILPVFPPIGFRGKFNRIVATFFNNRIGSVGRKNNNRLFVHSQSLAKFVWSSVNVFDPNAGHRRSHDSNTTATTSTVTAVGMVARSGKRGRQESRRRVRYRKTRNNKI